MNTTAEHGGIRGHLRVLGRALDTIIDRTQETYPNRTFVRVGPNIVYKDEKGKVSTVFDLREFDRQVLSFNTVFGGDGIIDYQRDEASEFTARETVFITRTPEAEWIRIWIPLWNGDQDLVRNILKVYGGLQGIPFDEVGTLPIQIGGAKARELRERAIYFEVNLQEPGIECRFPLVNPIVEKFASKNYGIHPRQFELSEER